jgi:GntR family transcriptional regulator
MFIVKLDKRKKEPYYKQIASSIKEGILEGRIKDGDRMPKMEDVANYFHISTIAVTLAYEQLSIDGFLKKVKGSGTFVSHRPKILLPMDKFYRMDYFFEDIKHEVRRDAHYIDIKDHQTTIKFTTYIKNYPTYHQEIIIFRILDIDVQVILNQPLSLFNVFFQFYEHEKLTYESFFQTKNADFQDAIILDINEKDPMFYIITNITSDQKLEAVVKTYYPSEFVTLEANI